MLIPGHSSAKISLLEVGNTTIFRKVCHEDLKDRLLIQAEKQRNCQQFEGIYVPSIFSARKSGHDSIVDMEFVQGVDFVTFTSSSAYHDFENAIQVLVKMIVKEFKDCNVEDFPKEKWKQKVESVFEDSHRKHRLDLGVMNEISQFLTAELPEKISIGTCHGDLTFSNVIVKKEGEVCIFDFLDPPIETPYEDAAKFLQDAKFFWSLNKYTGKCDKTRVKMYWERASQILLTQIEEHCDIETLRKFQILGLARIIPYTSDEKIVRYLLDCMIREVRCVANSALWR